MAPANAEYWHFSLQDEIFHQFFGQFQLVSGLAAVFVPRRALWAQNDKVYGTRVQIFPGEISEMNVPEGHAGLPKRGDLSLKLVSEHMLQVTVPRRIRRCQFKIHQQTVQFVFPGVDIKKD